MFLSTSEDLLLLFFFDWPVYLSWKLFVHVHVYISREVSTGSVFSYN